MTDYLSSNGTTRQLRLLALLLLPVLAILLAIYFAFLRDDYALLAQDLRPEEASAIVAELKKEDVGYKLERQGSAILVPASRADELRLAILGSGIADPGSVGFELFNESDMGLTDFAQKVNYQRALQGELARTIMGMDGIAYARVHLALPERSLFRANRSEPRAAVTVVPKANIPLDEARVAGIQQLVASTITDLKVENVVVLNQRGQLMTADPRFAAGDRMAEASPLEKAYADRVSQALATAASDLDFDVQVTTLPDAADSGQGTAAILPPEQRDYALRVVLFATASVPADRQAQLEQVVANAIGATSAAGDQIQFALEPALPAPAHQASLAAGTPAAELDKDASLSLINGPWIELAGLGAAALAGLALWLVARRRRSRRRELLYVRICEQLRIEAV